MTDKPDSNPNPRPFRISSLPPPISPLRGSSYIPPKKPQPINWAHWQLMPLVELQQAVALSVNVNPDNVTEVDDVLIKRMEIALSHVDAGSLPLERHYANQRMSPVALCKFADWAVKLNIPDLPPELVAMAARAPAQSPAAPAPVATAKRSEKKPSIETVALDYMCTEFKQGQFQSAAKFHKHLIKTAGQDKSPFEMGTGINARKLFCPAASSFFDEGTLSKIWAKIRAA